MSATENKAVFLSYAREDSAAAQRIAETLRTAGIEVWFDQEELRGGDAWDAKIRKQIKECALFVPIISANTQARPEGYFRLEWKLADRRTDLIGKSKPFLLPVCIDDTRERDADVPDSFLTAQWTRLPGGDAGKSFCARVKVLLGGTVDGDLRAPSATNAGLNAPGARISPRNRRALLAALACIIFSAALAVWRPWRAGAPGDTGPRSVAAKTSDEVAKLRARLIPDQWRKEDFEPWSAALDKIIAADDQNADAWALRSIINSLQVMRVYDMSTRPLEAGRAAAQRATHLAPGSALAELAVGMHHAGMITRGGDPMLARQHLRRAFEALPADALTRYADLTSAGLGYDFEQVARAAKAWLEAEPSADFPAYILGMMHLVRRDAFEAIKWFERSASERGVTGVRALVGTFDAEYYLRADLTAARKRIDAIPIGVRTAHRAVHASWLLAMAEHRWDLALQELSRIPEPVLFEGAYYGPKALLAAMAQQAAGRTEAAQVQFQDAEKSLRELLAGDSQNEPLHAELALTLACLGRSADARTELALVEPVMRGRRRVSYTGHVLSLLAHARTVLGDVSEATFWLREILSGPAARPFTPASLRIDPRFQSIIAKPEVQSLLAEFAHLDAPKTGGGVNSSTIADQKSVAVLAFRNLSDENDNDVFSDGISDELTNVLGRVPGLRVTGSTSAFSFKGKGATAQEIGQKLGVSYVVDGTVRKANGRVRISAKLINAADGFQVWASENLERELKDVWTVQDEIVGLIVKQLSLTLGSSVRLPKQVDPEAHRLVLEGRHFWNLRTPLGFAEAEKRILGALVIDPAFSQAHAALADIYAMRATYQVQEGARYGDVLEDVRKARAEGLRAIELDPAMAEAYPSLGYCFLLEGRFTEAEQQFKNALDRNPNYAVAHAWQAMLSLTRGRIDDALVELERSRTLEPLWVATLTSSAEILCYVGRFEEALQLSERVMALRPDGFVQMLGHRARALQALGRTREAVDTARAIRKQPNKFPRREADSTAIWVLCQNDLQSEAAAYAEEFLKTLAPESQQRGFILGALGRFDEALRFLEHTPTVPRRRLYYESMWDRWRDDARFAQLMEKLGCAAEYQTGRATQERLRKQSSAKR